MRALIVDDSRAVRAVVRRSLHELSFETFEAGNGLQALEQLETLGPVDVALVDWNMPEMGGFDLVCAVRANDAMKSMRIIMVTSESEIGRMTEALQAGADEYLMKPFVADALRDKLRMIGMEVA